MMASRQWVDISAEEIACRQLQMAAEHLDRASDDPFELTSAVRCAHLATVAIMTAALSGSAGVGALEQKARAAALKELGDGRIAFDERVMPFRELLQAVQEDGRLEWGPPVTLNNEQRTWLARLNGYRELIDHPKPTGWLLSAPDLAASVAAAARLFDDVKTRLPYQLDARQRRMASVAARHIREHPLVVHGSATPAGT